MWKRVGAAAIGPAAQVVTLGRVAADLTGGYLPLRFRSQAGDSLIPLSFGVVVPVTTAGEGGLPSGRYYPQQGASIVQLGPGVLSSFDGVIQFRPRSYNLKWLQVGYPAGRWDITAEVWAPVGLVTPSYEPSGWTDGDGLTFTITPERVGPAAAAPLAHD